MARRVFFSFHYDLDIWRVNQVRNSGAFKDIMEAGFFDHSLWEETKKRGDTALERVIGEGLANTTVTVVLAGRNTWERKWVRYELVKSLARGNGLMTIYIDKVKNHEGRTTERGPNPLNRLFFRLTGDGKSADTWTSNGKDWISYLRIGAASLPQAVRDAKEGEFSKIFTWYDWETEQGHDNFSTWVESAARKAGR